MSFERAQTNCERCYALANEIAKNLSGEPSFKKYSKEERIKTEIYKDDKIANARNDAIKALESMYERCLEIRKTAIDLSQNQIPINLTKKALEACAECDFKEPKISNLVK